jgi:hypothetical protein
MADAGYEVDAENKQLRKIEYNHYGEEFNDGWRNWSPRDLT